jgi:cell division transport system permease protein
LIRIIGSVVVGFLMLFSALIITMIIGFKIRIKRDEIEIMRLLGASTWFIRIPFIMEGIAYATFGSVLAFILSFGSVWYFEPLLINSLGDVSSQIFPISWIFIVSMLFINILVAFLIGAISSFNAVRRYLK